MFDTKLLIVGAGAGGLSAAITARQAGLKEIIVLEKRATPGGNAAVAPVFPVADESGHLEVDCQDDNRMYPDDPRLSPDRKTRTEANFNAAMDWTHWAGDARLIRDLIEKSEETSDWMRAMMDPEFVIPEGELGATGLLLLRECERLGIEIRCGRRVKKLVKDNDGRVCGVVADTDSGEERYSAQAVIVATGGFFGSPELMEKYFPNYRPDMYEKMHIMGIQHTGDGVRMAFDAGASSDGTAIVEWSVATLNDGGFWLNNNDFNPEVLWVNRRGERFGNEEKIALRNSVFRQPDFGYFVIHDEAAKEHMIYKKPEDMPPMAQKFYRRSNGKMYDRTDEGIERRIKNGTGLRCDTLEELAAFIGCDEQALKQTIAYYNESCDEGYDREFLKNPRHMLPIRTAPFYVWKEKINVMITHGPVKVSRRMELLGPGDEPIRGCYYAGLDIGGTEAFCYACCVACHSIGWAIASGRIAAETALRDILR